MSNIATNFNVIYFGSVGDGVNDDTNAIQNAINAAASKHGTVFFPAGIYRLTSHLHLPSGFSGNMAFLGSGTKTTILRQDGGDHGLYCDLSAGQPGNTSVSIEGISLVSNNSSVQDAIVITYGTGSVTLPPTVLGGILDNVSCDCIGSNPWSAGIHLVNCWGYQLSNISSCGAESNYTTRGAGLILDSCINTVITNAFFTFERFGIYIPTGSAAVGTSQGSVLTNIICVECVNCVYSWGTIYLSEFIFDNGNLVVSSHLTLELVGSGADGSYIANGQLLQAGGTCSLYLNGVSGSKVVACDFAYRNEATGAVILVDNASSNNNIDACTFDGFEVQCNSGTTGNVSRNHTNTGTRSALDSGTNRIGDDLGFTGGATMPGAGTTYRIYIDVTACGLGRKPDGVAASVTSEQAVTCQYDWDDLGNSPTQIALRFFLFSGGALPTDFVRYSVRCGP
jgi:hypothetical protein